MLPIIYLLQLYAMFCTPSKIYFYFIAIQEEPTTKVFVTLFSLFLFLSTFNEVFALSSIIQSLKLKRQVGTAIYRKRSKYFRFTFKIANKPCMYYTAMLHLAQSTASFIFYSICVAVSYGAQIAIRMQCGTAAKLI